MELLDALAESSIAPISVCLCSCGRVLELRRCLDSLTICKPRPAEILVSDDSGAYSKIGQLSAQYAEVRFFNAPVHGIPENRNYCVEQATQPWIALVDDDAVVRPAYWQEVCELTRNSPGKVVYTGKCIDHGGGRPTERIPGNATLLGFFGTSRKELLENIDLSSNLIPASAFKAARFDPNLVYGYEDMDLCTQLLKCGYRIVYRPGMVNDHIPPEKTPDEMEMRVKLSEWARGYCLFKKRYYWRRQPVAAVGLHFLYLMHRLASAWKRGRVTETGRIIKDFYSVPIAVWRLSHFPHQSATLAS